MLNGIITPLSAHPLLTFLCVSVVLFKNAFYSRWQFAERETKGRGCSNWDTKSGSDTRFSGLCTIIRASNITFFDLEWFGGTLQWGHSGNRRWLVSKWLGYEWEHSPHRKYQTRVVWCFWIIHKKNLAMPKCYWCHYALFGSCGHEKDSGGLIAAFLMHRVMGNEGMKEDESMCEMCFFAETTAVLKSSCLWLYSTDFTVELWVICREALLTITGQKHFTRSIFSTVPLAKNVFLNCSTKTLFTPHALRKIHLSSHEGSSSYILIRRSVTQRWHGGEISQHECQPVLCLSVEVRGRSR